MGQKSQPSSQQRKKRVLEEVQKQRKRQKTITLAVMAVVLVAIIVGGVYVLAHQSSSTLPAYLNICVSGYAQGYHAHYHLTISLKGPNEPNETIPPNTGIDGSCLRPLHTHDQNGSSDNVVHVEPDNNQTFKLGDFFLIWGQPFNSTRIMYQKYQPGQLSMTINGGSTGVPNGDFWDYVIPHDAQSGTNICSHTVNGSPSCEEIDIALVYNPAG